MKIKEILELSFTVKMDVIAKEHLSIGEKRLRDIMKQAGCTHQRGKKGWIFTGEDPAILEKSIYDFVQPTAYKKTDSQKSTKETKQDNNYIENRETKKPVRKQENKEINKKTKKVTYEIETDLHDELKIRAIREKRNVSEIVNEIIKKGLE